SLLDAIEAAGYDALRESVVLDVVSDAFDPDVLQQALLGVQGVVGVDVNPEARRASVTFPAGSVDTRQLLRAAEAAGIELRERAPESDAPAGEAARREQRTLVYKWVTAGIAGALMMLAGMEFALDRIQDVMSIQELLYLMFAVALPIQVWAGWQFYA